MGLNGVNREFRPPNMATEKIMRMPWLGITPSHAWLLYGRATGKSEMLGTNVKQRISVTLGGEPVWTFISRTSTFMNILHEQ